MPVDASFVLGGLAIAWCLVAAPLVFAFWGARPGRLVRLVGVAVLVTVLIVVLGLVAFGMMASSIGGE